MSELLVVFGEGERVSMGSLEIGVKALEDNNLHSLPSTFKLSSKWDIISSLNKKRKNKSYWKQIESQ
jgi:hypothetical protein